MGELCSWTFVEEESPKLRKIGALDDVLGGDGGEFVGSTISLAIVEQKERDEGIEGERNKLVVEMSK